MVADNVSKVNQPVSYVCNKCYYVTKDMKDIEKHSKNCDVCYDCKFNPIEYMSMIHQNQQLREENQKLTMLNTQIEIEKQTLEKIIEKNIKHSQDFDKKYQTKSIQTDTYDSVKKSEPNAIINVCDKLTDKSTDDISNKLKESNIENIIVEKEESSIIKTRDRQNSHDGEEHKKSVFRMAKGIEIYKEQTIDEVNEIYKKIDEKEIEDNQELFCITSKAIYEKIESLMNLIKTQRTYTAELKEMRETRIKLSRFLSQQEYTEYINNHIEHMKTIFSTRITDQKKINSLIKNKLLLPLELRLIEYNGYETVEIDTNEISIYKKLLRYRCGLKKDYEVFNRDEIFTLYSTYNISLFNVIDYIKILIPNKYGINNLIYLDIPKSTSEDPYSFYYLEQINGKNRHWKMDCRLDDLLTDISSKSLEYCISLYRKIHYDLYHDNDYRGFPDGSNQILEYEGEQLIQNIIILSDYIKFNNSVRQIIKEKCLYRSTRYDKFNLQSDDPICKKRFNSLKKQSSESTILENIKRLFDKISDNQVNEIYISKINN